MGYALRANQSYTLGYAHAAPMALKRQARISAAYS